MNLNSFLKQTRQLLLNLQQKQQQHYNGGRALFIVIGNESCDLDSAVCAITLAFLRKWNSNCDNDFLPILNIPRCEYVIKTEVKYLFEKYAIQDKLLIFRNELTPDIIAASRFILVDHHVSPFAAQVIEVFDHRPYDAQNGNLPAECLKIIEPVGSCATLIAEQYLCYNSNDQTINTSLPYKLLQHTIILDTVNFSIDARRATAKDCEIFERLEAKQHSTPAERAQIFNELITARSDIRHLSIEQILRKDMKIIHTQQGWHIGLPGFPMLVNHFIKLPNVATSLRDFAAANDFAIVILLGMSVRTSTGTVQRDLGLILIAQHLRPVAELFNYINLALIEAQSPSFDLMEQHVQPSFMQGIFYRQTNNKITRKHILPVVKKALAQWLSTQKSK